MSLTGKLDTELREAKEARNKGITLSFLTGVLLLGVTTQQVEYALLAGGVLAIITGAIRSRRVNQLEEIIYFRIGGRNG